ncbi:hypothetical protein [Rhizobium lentis]|uniref:Uncharacterized protein n=1 Tax=Rhizobium lentis TaxID=1138194 RepID=A0A7W8UP33_9HYPH|nr:hypothetical protein [Rhizobium lentis]MBB5551031.1 hypothetical protein [Rhizobium lentis]MBB5561566.1 hypothetical protein [Rhizobium lentis]MBB5568150.1 hypothetical protein [Rhizobium lentis]
MLDAQSIYLKALDSADLDGLNAILNIISREAGAPLCAPEMQAVAAMLIKLYRHGVTDEEKLLSVGRLALKQAAARLPLSRPPLTVRPKSASKRSSSRTIANNDEQAGGVRTNHDPSNRNKIPPVGPHARDDLTDRSKTPGAGSLPEKDEESITPGSG